MANYQDSAGDVNLKNGVPILNLFRQRILRGYITKDGHLDDSEAIHIESIQVLKENEFLIEMYPGLAALLKKDGDYYVFIQVCPHALSETGVQKLVQNWSRVVVYMEGSEIARSQDADVQDYLGPWQMFDIR
jgi:hypothetical protein